MSDGTQTGRFDRLSTDDLINLWVEAPDTPMHVGAVVTLAARRQQLPEIRAAVEQRLASLPQLRRVIYRPGPLAGRPIWVEDPAFHIHRQVDLVELPAPGDEAVLLRTTEDLIKTPLDRSGPLWRMWWLTELATDEIAFVLILHHAIADGPAALHLAMTLFDDAPDAVATTVDVRPQGEPPRWPELVGDNLRVRLAAIARTVRALSPRRLGRLGRTAVSSYRMLRVSWHAPRTSLNAPIGPRRRLAVLRLDLADSARVAHSHDGKINDVILGLAAAGLRALLQARHQPVDGLMLHAAVAVSLRAGDQRAAAGNRTGGIVVRLPLGEPDSDQRLRSIAANSAMAKRSQLLTLGQGLLVWVARLGLMRRFSRRQRLSNIIESNVVGPAAPVRVLGASVRDLVPIGNLAGNLAVSFLALSYAGRLTIAVRADADVFPDLPVLLAAMRQECRHLGLTLDRGSEALP